MRSRKRKYAGSLPLDQNGELVQGKVLLTVSQGMGDPVIEYELKEFITEVVDAALQLPPKEKATMLRVLWDEIGNIFPLEEMLQQHGIDVERIPCPRTLKELQRFHSLLSVARKKLRAKFKRFAEQSMLAFVKSITHHNKTTTAVIRKEKQLWISGFALPVRLTFANYCLEI